MNLYSQLFLYQALKENMYNTIKLRIEAIWVFYLILQVFIEFTNFRKPTIFENATCTNVLHTKLYFLISYSTVFKVKVGKDGVLQL